MRMCILLSCLLSAAARTFSLVDCPVPVDTGVSLFLEVLDFPQMKQLVLMSNPAVSFLLILVCSVAADVHGCWSLSLGLDVEIFDLLVYLARHDLWNDTFKSRLNMSCCKGQILS